MPRGCSPDHDEDADNLSRIVQGRHAAGFQHGGHGLIDQFGAAHQEGAGQHGCILANDLSQAGIPAIPAGFEPDASFSQHPAQYSGLQGYTRHGSDGQAQKYPRLLPSSKRKAIMESGVSMADKAGRPNCSPAFKTAVQVTASPLKAINGKRA